MIDTLKLSKRLVQARMPPDRRLKRAIKAVA
jgi:hypothetical protein